MSAHASTTRTRRVRETSVQAEARTGVKRQSLLQRAKSLGLRDGTPPGEKLLLRPAQWDRCVTIEDGRETAGDAAARLRVNRSALYSAAVRRGLTGPVRVVGGPRFTQGVRLRPAQWDEVAATLREVKERAAGARTGQR